MLIRSCPNCQKFGHFLQDASACAYVDYYRCDSCGHVWSLDRNDPDAQPRDVTVPVKKHQVSRPG